MCRSKDYKTFYENFDIVYIGLGVFVAMVCGMYLCLLRMLGYNSALWDYFQARDLKCKTVNPAVFKCITCK